MKREARPILRNPLAAARRSENLGADQHFGARPLRYNLKTVRAYL